MEDLTDPQDILMEEDKEIIMAESKERNNGRKTATLVDNDIIEIPIVFPPKPNPGSFFVHCIVESWKLRELCVMKVQGLVHCHNLCFKSFT